MRRRVHASSRRRPARRVSRRRRTAPASSSPSASRSTPAARSRASTTSSSRAATSSRSGRSARPTSRCSLRPAAGTSSRSPRPSASFSGPRSCRRQGTASIRERRGSCATSPRISIRAARSSRFRLDAATASPSRSRRGTSRSSTTPFPASSGSSAPTISRPPTTASSPPSGGSSRGSVVNLSQRVLFNTLAQVAGKVALLLAGLATLRLVTGYLGVETFGDYAIVLSLAPILSVFADLGIATLLARELVHSPHRRDELAATLLWFRIAASVGIFLVFLAITPFLPYDHHVKVGLLIACLGVSFVALLDCLVAVLMVGSVAIVTAADLGFYALVGVNALVGLASITAAAVLVRRFWRPSLRVDRGQARRLLSDGLPLAAVIVLGLLHFRIDAVLLSLLRPAEDVGIYTVAYRFLEQSLVLPGVFMAAVFPLLAAAVRGGGADDVIRKSFSFLLLVAAPLALALVVLADPLVRLVAGDGFEAAAVPLRILAPALVFAFVNAVFASLLIALNRQRALIVVSAAGILLNVVANLYAIPRYGYVGAAVTTVISEGVGLCAVFVLARRALPFRLSPRLVTRADVALLLGR